jgi:hypothetical protein
MSKLITGLVTLLLSITIAGAQTPQAPISLLSNATATGGSVGWPGGPGAFTVNGTLNGATVTLQYLSTDGVTWVPATPISNACSIIASSSGSGNCLFNIGPRLIRAAVTGGSSPTGIYADVQRVGQ